jgi:hypothetical protein
MGRRDQSRAGVIAVLAKAPDLRLKWSVEAKLTYWLARKDCKRLIDRLRAL